MLYCVFCQRECKNTNSKSNHERLCQDNPNKCEHPRGAKGITPWNKGKKLHYVVGTKGRSGTFLGRTHSIETREKMSISAKDRYLAGWECVAGRCKKYEYESPIAGKVKVDGTWELVFCKYLDAKKLTWVRNKTRFKYTRPDGRESTYQPDFFVEEWQTYVEVKGYETDLDKSKWSQLPHPLKVIRRKEICEMDEWLKSTPC